MKSARTAIPPTTPFANTVSSTPSEGMTSPVEPVRGRRGRTRNDATAMANVGIPMKPLKRRLTCSIAV